MKRHPNKGIIGGIRGIRRNQKVEEWTKLDCCYLNKHRGAQKLFYSLQTTSELAPFNLYLQAVSCTTLGPWVHMKICMPKETQTCLEQTEHVQWEERTGQQKWKLRRCFTLGCPVWIQCVVLWPLTAITLKAAPSWFTYVMMLSSVFFQQHTIIIQTRKPV